MIFSRSVSVSSFLLHFFVPSFFRDKKAHSLSLRSFHLLDTRTTEPLGTPRKRRSRLSSAGVSSRRTTESSPFLSSSPSPSAAAARAAASQPPSPLSSPPPRISTRSTCSLAGTPVSLAASCLSLVTVVDPGSLTGAFAFAVVVFSPAPLSAAAASAVVVAAVEKGGSASSERTIRSSSMLAAIGAIIPVEEGGKGGEEEPPPPREEGPPPAAPPILLAASSALLASALSLSPTLAPLSVETAARSLATTSARAHPVVGCGTGRGLPLRRSEEREGKRTCFVAAADPSPSLTPLLPSSPPPSPPLSSPLATKRHSSSAHEEKPHSASRSSLSAAKEEGEGEGEGEEEEAGDEEEERE